MKIFNYKKSIIAIIVVSILSVSAGCRKDFLNREAQGSYNQNNYPYPQGAGPYDQFINGAYSVLRSFNVTVWPFIGIVSIRSDDADKGSTPADSGDQIQMDNLGVTASNGLVDAFWTGHYDLINKCNFVLERVAKDPNPNTPDNLKIAAQAEARFLRGYAYFMLVRSYGRVPLVDTVITKSAAEANIPQSQPAAIYQFIENDLTFAATNLPASYDPKFVGRATSGAANGLLAKVYLYEKKWAQAMDAANKVMTSGQYDLSTPYAQIFNESGENSKESVFEVQATATASNPTAYGSQYSNVQGVRGTGQWDLGWGFNVPSTALEAAFEPNDPRKARTILYAGGTSIYGEAIPAGLPNPRYNNKVYTDPARRAQIGNRFGWWNNVRLLRYADVVLMYAEAANELGGTANKTNALAALNSVRARARGGNNAILPDVTTTDQTALRDAIRHERRVELGMEHERFFDIVRWGIAADVLQAQGKTFIVGKNELLPIPQNQIDLSKGVLTQNPGY
ncbi:MAG: RagB/SusD family nutrient uptake outer membrane protein [Bacteroidetes bacterium]|nr:RagB/SusD family nutrient uptake outer membrane protein [Bacteroidota bacterium]MBU1372893.1 RagB/SusD family nutrient uptake outer membrane protein [Bacteroidota bacterium]MBU1485622.1 RagB/SusD family nutrient uptake outer membrane protein [Bacteroidota bacterium]MBU1760541.1 RagB/SusD family nutrient uptake outer membrane protein [Bacteroidota bacterium]MBU2268913.1 RagB/SusD family nutrient uptake outer membrane protein [Bacteroidota bacterium]